MGKPVFLLLGGNKLNYGILNKFQRIGYLVYVIDWNETPQLIGDRHFQIDVKDPVRIITELDRKNVWKNVKFAYSSIDLAVPSVAYINRELGLNTISNASLQFACSKSKMTERWKKSGLLNRISLSLRDYNSDLLDLNKTLKLIVKPDNSASSRGITVVDKGSDQEYLIASFEKAKKEATNGIVVVEEYVDGTEYTVEMIGDSFGNVTVYGVSQKTHTKNTDANRIAVKLHYNSVDDYLQKRIAEYGIRCYKSLGFSSSLGHLEVLLKEDGTISPVEIGARSSGYIASDLVDIVSGVSFLEELIAVQKGKKLSNGFHQQTESSSMYYFYDFPPEKQIIKKTSILDYCDTSISSRYYDRDAIVVGAHFNKIKDDNARWGYEILEGPKQKMTKEHIECAEREMLQKMFGE